MARSASSSRSKYPGGETDFRYLVATDLSWRTLDIVQVDTL
ncbi:hypothetical protein [Thiocystis violacea]|nr:hypothetical protein [Thiocystis violacea]